MSPLIERVRVQGSDEQRAAVADGKVSFEEYEVSVLTYVACLESAGYEVDATLRFQGRYYDVTSSTDGTETELMRDSWSACSENFSLILDVWSVQNQPSEAELQAARRALASCLRDRGVDVNVDPSGKELGDLAASGRPGFAQCSQKVSEEFGLPGFAG